METRSIEHLEEFNFWYDLLLLYRDSKNSDEKKRFAEILDELGFWSPDENIKSDYVTPFKANKKTIVFNAPKEWTFGDFPVEGNYSFVLIWQDDSEGERSWHIKNLSFDFKKDELVYPRSLLNAYLFTFIHEKKYLQLHVGKYIPEKDSPEYPEALKKWKIEEKIREIAVKMAPELSHYLWPENLIFEGEWLEESLESPNYFKKTLELVMGEFVRGYKNRVEFHPLVWNNNRAQLTAEIAYTQRDEHAYRTYGIEQEVELKKEIGVWLEKCPNSIDFKVIQNGNSTWFEEFSGKLFDDKIQLEMRTPYSKEDKEFCLDYFHKYGIKASNIVQNLSDLG